MRFMILIAALALLGGCATQYTPAMRSEVIALEDKVDEAFETMSDTVVSEVAQGKEPGDAAVAAIAAGHEFTAEAKAVEDGELPAWLLAILPAILGMLGINSWRNRTRKTALDEVWEA